MSHSILLILGYLAVFLPALGGLLWGMNRIAR